MKRLYLLVIILSSAFMCAAQTPMGSNVVSPVGFMVNTISGEVFSPIKYSNLVEGTPYYKDEWLKATITFAEGLEFKEVLIKLDLMDQNVHYRDKDGREMISSTPIKQIAFNEMDNGLTVFANSSFLGAAQSQPSAGWLIQLQTGRAALYKQLFKSISENQPYNSATVEQRIRTSDRYFVLKDGKLQPIKKWSDLINLLNDKSADVEKFLGTHKMKGKSESDYLELVQFYNDLPN